MRKKRKYYDFYVKCMDLPIPTMPLVSTPETEGGLCSVFPKAMGIFKPTEDNIREFDLFYGGQCFWGSDLYENSDDAATDFSAFRQTIVLFLAAMNGEL